MTQSESRPPSKALKLPKLDDAPQERIPSWPRRRLLPHPPEPRRPRLCSRQGHALGYGGFRPVFALRSKQDELPGFAEAHADMAMTSAQNLIPAYRLAAMPNKSLSQSIFTQEKSLHAHQEPFLSKRFHRNVGRIPGYGNFTNFIDMSKGQGRHVPTWA